jgi:putative phosphoesterase
MKIAILSDTHDNVWKIDAALALAREAGVGHAIFCGDFCAPFSLVRLAKLGVPIEAVWGNNDGDKWLLTVQANKVGNVTLHGELAELELGGLKIGVNHYPNIAKRLAQSGAYDVVCYGHDHVAHEEQVGNCLLLNPGEVMGRDGRSSFIILDTETRAVRFMDVT